MHWPEWRSLPHLHHWPASGGEFNPHLSCALFHWVYVYLFKSYPHYFDRRTSQCAVSTRKIIIFKVCLKLFSIFVMHLRPEMPAENCFFFILRWRWSMVNENVRTKKKCIEKTENVNMGAWSRSWENDNMKACDWRNPCFMSIYLFLGWIIDTLK